ncbi:MAG TPA: hypothetical protein V6D10_07315 [Trichocoleus sp.]|jgi:hypothetical protein
MSQPDYLSSMFSYGEELFKPIQEQKKKHTEQIVRRVRAIDQDVRTAAGNASSSPSLEKAYERSEMIENLAQDMKNRPDEYPI